MQTLSFRERLQHEFDQRRAKNARYSLRSFARFLATDHSTLSQVLQGKRRVPVRQLRSWGRKLGMSADEAAVYVIAQRIPAEPVSRRQEQLRHWTAEAMAVLNEPAHWHIVRLSRQKDFKSDSRWIARESGCTIDEVNLALSRLLRLRLLEVTRSGRWNNESGLKQLNETAFRKLALVRVRELAAADGVAWNPRRNPSAT